MGKVEAITLAISFLFLLTVESIADTTTIMSPDGSVTVCTVGDGGIVICV